MNSSDTVTFILDGEFHHVRFSEETPFKPAVTVLNYLRMLEGHKGVKEGCAEGDCGACTVVVAELAENETLRYRAIDACLVFLPMIHGKQLITVENLKNSSGNGQLLHPVQEALVTHNGSQCGYCTPGFAMSMFALYKHHNHPSREVVLDALTGNLCRCTGYQPIVDAALHACCHEGKDHLSEGESQIFQSLLQLKTEAKTLELRSCSQVYYRPADLSDALKLRQQYPDAVLVAGATDVALRQTKKNEHLPLIIDLSGTEELKTTRITDAGLIIGAGVDMETVKIWVKNDFLAFFELLTVFGSLQIRNMATLGGNIGSASPVADTLPLLYVMKALVKVVGSKGERTIPIENFITGYRTIDLKADELIHSVLIPWHKKEERIRFYKISRRKDLDISTVCAAFSLVLEDGVVEQIIMAFGGMAAQTKRAAKAESFLTGKKWDAENIHAAMELIKEEFTPISDARAEKEVRQVAAANLLLKFCDDLNK
jgi:xanthine dehydrogenase small subunit